MTEEEEGRVTQLKELLVGAGEEKKIVTERHETVQKELAEKNEFADAIEEHREVAHDHAHRVEQATKQASDEL